LLLKALHLTKKTGKKQGDFVGKNIKSFQKKTTKTIIQ